MRKRKRHENTERYREKERKTEGMRESKTIAVAFPCFFPSPFVIINTELWVCQESDYRGQFRGLRWDGIGKGKCV